MKPHLYFIGIIPPDDLLNQINLLKRDISEKYACRHALKTPAHITLQMPFKRFPEIESYLQEKLKHFSENYFSFPVELNGFGHFGNRVIFIAIQKNESLDMLFKRLSNYLLNERVLIENEIKQQFVPHITLAHRDLKSEKFNYAWNEYGSKFFSERFIADSMTLFRHNFKKWEIINNFKFDRNYG